MARTGLCEDDPAIRRVVSRALELAGHEVVTAHTGREALELLGPGSALDVIVLDIGLPDADGRDVCQALRTAGQQAPVLFLTALGAVHERLAGFGAGGDDYLPKPFDLKELIARVEALARRSRPDPPAPDREGPVLDPATHCLHHDGVEIPLTPTEFRMLAAITSRPGEVVRRQALVAAGWPDGARVSENTVDSFIRRIRGKLDRAGSPYTLQTVRGVGYRIR